MVLFAITGASLKYQYPIRANHVVLCQIPNIIIVLRLLCYINLAFIGSEFIDPELRRCCKLSVGRIQTRHTDFLAP